MYELSSAKHYLMVTHKQAKHVIYASDKLDEINVEE